MKYQQQARKDHFQEVTDSIIAALEAGTKPWARPWNPDLAGGPQSPFNPVTGKHYHGINVLLLAMSPLAFCSGDPRWMTYQQASERKWQVRKGEKSTTIFFYKPLQIENKDRDEGDPETRTVGLLRTYAVFHSSQIDGIPPHKAPSVEEAPWTRPEAANIILTNSQAVIRIGGDRAFYSPSTDHIQLPPEAALDMRIIDPVHEPDDQSKVARATDRIFAAWQATHDRRLTQLVFCDLSTPNPDRFNVYHEVRERLLERGIPEREIAFIHDADTDLRKKTLFDSVNAGRIRILFGSTEKMGAGMNVQKRLKALHHLDAPWRPRDIEQREGRILRQGNDNAEVEIHRYVTEGSFDAYMWQCLETKARFINQVMNGSVTVRQAEDLESGALTYAEIKAIASGNPAVMEKVRVDTEIRKLDQLRASHINQQHKIKWQVKNLPSEIERSRKYHAAFVEDIATRDAHDAEDFSMTIGNRTFTGKDARANSGEALNEVDYSLRFDQSWTVRGHFKGFEILTRGTANGDSVPELLVRGKEAYKANLNLENPLGTIASIEHAIRSLDRHAESERREIERNEKALGDYTAQLNRPFEHADRLKELLSKQAELNAALDLDKHDVQTVGETPEAAKEAAQAAPAPFDPGPMPPAAVTKLPEIARPVAAAYIEPA